MRGEPLRVCGPGGILGWLVEHHTGLPVCVPDWPADPATALVVAVQSGGPGDPVTAFVVPDARAMEETMAELGSRSLWFYVPHDRLPDTGGPEADHGN